MWRVKIAFSTLHEGCSLWSFRFALGSDVVRIGKEIAFTRKHPPARTTIRSARRMRTAATTAKFGGSAPRHERGGGGGRNEDEASRQTPPTANSAGTTALAPSHRPVHFQIFRLVLALGWNFHATVGPVLTPARDGCAVDNVHCPLRASGKQD